MLNQAGVPRQWQANYSGPRAKKKYVKKKKKTVQLLMTIKNNNEDGQTRHEKVT